MLARIRKAMEQKEEGFTLIELLVVIIIIGILAAIAIPVFLSQRTKGYDASVKSDLRNTATAEETYLTDNPTSYGSAALLAQNNLVKAISNGNTVNVYYNAAQDYCLVGGNVNSTNWFLYDSGAGGLSTTLFSSAANALAKCSDTTAAANPQGTFTETNGAFSS
ncbi:MAG: prepilin-type N-terminal cleavage/methylation domain-containing protein [Mycobacteriales bacterium]